MFVINVGRKKGALRRVIEESRRSLSSWVGMGPMSQGFFLEGIERAFRVSNEEQWHWGWKEEGRKYSMIKDVNQPGPYVRLPKIDAGEKIFHFCVKRTKKRRRLAGNGRNVERVRYIDEDGGSEREGGDVGGRGGAKKKSCSLGVQGHGGRSFAKVLKNVQTL